MNNPFLSFALGLLIGGVIGWFTRKFFKTAHTEPAWDILNACVQTDGTVKIEIDLPASTPDLVQIHTKVENAEPSPLPAMPTAGAAAHSPATTLVNPPPSFVLSPPDCVLVWAEFRIFSVRAFTGTLSPCSGSGFMLEKARMLSAANAEQLEAVPKAYRVSVGSSGAGGAAADGPAAMLGAALARAAGAVLQYDPEDSTPTEPLWRGRGEPESGLEWILRLLHRSGGFGAVLSVVHRAGRETRLTWATNDWRFHQANRLTCDSDDAGGLSLVVQPA